MYHRNTTVEASTADEARVNALAGELGATIHYDVRLKNKRGPWSNPRSKQVHLYKKDQVDPQLTFWVALHELGHIASDTPFGAEFFTLIGSDDVIAEYEAQAWNWAIDNAGRPLDEYAKANIVYSMGSYFYSFGRPTMGPELKKLLMTVGAPPSVALVNTIDHYDVEAHGATAIAYWNLARKLVSENDLANAA